jgi:hypothetical protein
MHKSGDFYRFFCFENGLKKTPESVFLKYFLF